MRRYRLLDSLVAVMLGMGLVIPTAHAQEATPGALIGDTAPGSACTVEPRPTAFFEQFVGTPMAMAATPESATAATFQLPEGEPVDEETLNAVFNTLQQLAACLNAGDFARYAAVFTDEYWQREFEQFGPIAEEDLAFLGATPQPLPEQVQAAMLGIVDVRTIEDGRVAGLFDVYDPYASPPGPARFYWEFVEQDGVWLIDEQVMLGPIDAELVGTPIP